MGHRYDGRRRSCGAKLYRQIRMKGSCGAVAHHIFAELIFGNAILRLLKRQRVDENRFVGNRERQPFQLGQMAVCHSDGLQYRFGFQIHLGGGEPV